MSVSSINRRALVKGAAWAAPAVIATASIPAYAASQNLSYWLDGSWGGCYNRKTSSYRGCQNSVYLYNSEPYGKYAAGFRVGHDDGASPDTTATLTSALKFYCAIPKGYADSFTVTSGSWVYLGKQDISSLPDAQNRPISTSGMDVHVFQWSGSKNGKALSESSMTPWDASNTFEAVGTSSACVYGSFKAIGGYISDFSTGNGFSTQNASTVNSKWIYAG